MAGHPHQYELKRSSRRVDRGQIWTRYRSNIARHLIGTSRDLESKVVRSLAEEGGYEGLRPSFGTFRGCGTFQPTQLKTYAWISETSLLVTLVVWRRGLRRRSRSQHPAGGSDPHRREAGQHYMR